MRMPHPGSTVSLVKKNAIPNQSLIQATQSCPPFALFGAIRPGVALWLTVLAVAVVVLVDAPAAGAFALKCFDPDLLIG
jgi:hypothetical protein